MNERDAPEIRVGVQTGVSYREVRTRSRVVLVGRGAGYDMAPQVDLDHDESVSRRHAEIRKTQAGYVIVDLRSTNGTWVNGERIEPGKPMALKDGDRVTVGRLSVLTVNLPAAEADKAKDAGTSPEV